MKKKIAGTIGNFSFVGSLDTKKNPTFKITYKYSSLHDSTVDKELGNNCAIIKNETVGVNTNKIDAIFGITSDGHKISLLKPVRIKSFQNILDSQVKATYMSNYMIYEDHCTLDEQKFSSLKFSINGMNVYSDTTTIADELTITTSFFSKTLWKCEVFDGEEISLIVEYLSLDRNNHNINFKRDIYFEVKKTDLNSKFSIKECMKKYVNPIADLCSICLDENQTFNKISFFYQENTSFNITIDRYSVLLGNRIHQLQPTTGYSNKDFLIDPIKLTKNQYANFLKSYHSNAGLISVITPYLGKKMYLLDQDNSLYLLTKLESLCREYKKSLNEPLGKNSTFISSLRYLINSIQTIYYKKNKSFLFNEDHTQKFIAQRIKSLRTYYAHNSNEIHNEDEDHYLEIEQLMIIAKTIFMTSVLTMSLNKPMGHTYAKNLDLNLEKILPGNNEIKLIGKSSILNEVMKS